MKSSPASSAPARYEPASSTEMRLQQVLRRGAYRVWRRLLRAHAPAAGGPRDILDVGCGPGYFLRECGRWFPAARLAGIDYEPALLEWVRVPDAALKVGSAEKLEFSDGSFDVVACLQVLEHLPRPDAAIGEIFRVLRPGGLACIATPNLGCLSSRVARKKWHGFRDDHIALRSGRDWHAALAAGGFEVVSEGTTLLSGMPVLRLPPFVLMNWIPLYLFGFFPWTGGESYMALCRKPQA